jgi:penicillin-insensitive murein endopeptidase
MNRVKRRRASRILGVLLALSGVSCAGPNLWTDLTSVSTGNTNDGRIRKAAKMPLRGKGWTIGPRWKDRKFHYGVDELVAAVQRAAARVSTRDRRAVLGVADFSRQTGGSSIWHSSHESGRDVDLLFYSADEKGRPMPPPQHEMIRYDAEGKPFVGPKAKGYVDPRWSERRFDARRNWDLIESLLTDPSIRIQWVFVSEDLEALMLRNARRRRRPAWIVEYAAVVMNQPGDSLPHDDHFHIRVYCSRADRFHGCIDRGVVWQHEKKTVKYGGPERYDPVMWRLVLGPPRPMIP